MQREFKQRVQQGLEKAGARKELDDVQDSDVIEDDSVEDTDPPPKAGRRGSAPASGSRPTEKTADSPAPTGAAKTEGKTDDDAGEGKRPQPRYDSRSFTAWINNNPDKAAELATKVFKTQLGGNAEAWKQHFISAENGRRRHTEQVEKDRQELEAGKAELERLAKEAREPVEAIIDVIEAEQKEDYPAIDRFIEATFKMPFNEYCQRRLRGLNKDTPTERAQKQKIAQLQKELAEAKGGDGKPAETEEKSKAPQVSQKWIEREIPEDHGVRDLGNWQEKVREAYAASYDEEGDEYGLSIEDAAQQVLDAFLKKRTTPPPGKGGKGQEQRRQRPAARTQTRERPQQRGKVWTDDDEDDARTPAAELDEEQPPEGFQDRVSWALQRAGRRR